MGRSFEGRCVRILPGPRGPPAVPEESPQVGGRGGGQLRMVSPRGESRPPRRTGAPRIRQPRTRPSVWVRFRRVAGEDPPRGLDPLHPNLAEGKEARPPLVTG